MFKRAYNCFSNVKIKESLIAPVTAHVQRRPLACPRKLFANPDQHEASLHAQNQVYERSVDLIFVQRP
jgi:hypothetical protein